MTLLYVTVVGNLGPAAAGAKGYWVPTGWLTAASDMRVIPPAPLPPFTIGADGSFTSGPLLAQDSPGVQPQGEAWQLSINGIDEVAPFTQTYQILHANGDTQDLADLGVVVPDQQFTTYLLSANNLSDVPDPAAGLANLGGASSASLAGEVTRAVAAEAALATAISAETTRAEGAESALGTAIAAETTRAEAAEALLAPKASPAFTGTPAAPTAPPGTDSTQLATTAYADAAVAVETSRAETAEALKAPLASPALTGSPTAPTQTTGDSSTKIATDAFVGTAVGAETTRAEAAEALAALKSANLSDLANAGTARTNLGLGTAATQPASAFDTAGAAAAAQAASTGLRTPTAVLTGTSCTVAAGQFAKIDSTAGAYTATLVAAPADKTVAGVKLVKSAATVSPVTVTCGGSDTFNDGGGTTLALKLLNQGCLLQYNAGAACWDVHADDLPIGGLDSRYANVFSPLAYGAKGDGTTDDTTPVAAAYAAAHAAGGTMDLGTRTFRTTTAIALLANATVRGGGLNGGGIVNSASDIFSVSGTVTAWNFQGVTLTASAGHIFNCAAGSSVSLANILNCNLVQSGTSFAIWYMPSGNYIDVLVGDNCFLTCASGATVSPWTVISANNAVNSNTWRRMRVQASHAAVPFFHIENQGSGGYASDNKFDGITAEECDGGVLTALSVSFLTVDNIAAYDTTTFTGHLFNIGTGAGSNRSGFIVIRNSCRRGGSLAAGVFDVNAAPTVASLVLENVGPESGTGTYSVPAGQTTLIGNGSAITTGSGFSAAGVASQVTAGARLVGGIASGVPSGSSWLAGDIAAVQTGGLIVWNGTAWVPQATIDATATDIQPIGSQAAGASSLAASASHAHSAGSSGLRAAADYGFLITNGAMENASTVSAALTSTGTLYLFRVIAQGAVTITDLRWIVNLAGTGASTGSFAGLYSSTGTLLSGSADIGTSFTGGGGGTTCTLTTPQPLTAGQPAWAALLLNLTTGPKLYGWGMPVSNVNSRLGTSSYLWAVNGTGLSALPATITVSSNTSTNAVAAFVGGF